MESKPCFFDSINKSCTRTYLDNADAQACLWPHGTGKAHPAIECGRHIQPPEKAKAQRAWPVVCPCEQEEGGNINAKSQVDGELINLLRLRPSKVCWMRLPMGHSKAYVTAPLTMGCNLPLAARKRWQFPSDVWATFSTWITIYLFTGTHSQRIAV